MKIGVTGTQHGWSEAQRTAFELIIAQLEITEFHHGDCVGVDEQAANAVRRRFGLNTLHTHPPEESRKRAFISGGIIYPKKPYLMRNNDIVSASELLIVLPKTEKQRARSGTWYTYRRAKKSNTKVIVIGPDGRRIE